MVKWGKEFSRFFICSKIIFDEPLYKHDFFVQNSMNVFENENERWCVWSGSEEEDDTPLKNIMPGISTPLSASLL